MRRPVDPVRFNKGIHQELDCRQPELEGAHAIVAVSAPLKRTIAVR